MAQSDPQTDHSHDGRDAHESTLADGEAESRDQAVATSAEESSPADAQGAESAEWGLAAKKEPMARETKIGLALIVVLVCAFSVVLYKRMQDREGYPGGDDGIASSDEQGSRRGSSSTNRPGAKKRRRDGSATSGDNHFAGGVRGGQKEPRRIDDAPKPKVWAQQPRHTPFAKKVSTTRSLDNNSGSNPFAAGGNATGHKHPDDGQADSHDKAHNPFAGGSKSTGLANAKTVGFGKTSSGGRDVFGQRKKSPFGNADLGKTGENGIDGSATSTDDSGKSKLGAGVVRLSPAKPGGIGGPHRRAEYVEKNPADGNATSDEKGPGKEPVFGLGPDPQPGSKQMQPLDNDANRRFAQGRRSDEGDSKFNPGKQPFGSGNHRFGEDKNRPFGKNSGRKFGEDDGGRFGSQSRRFASNRDDGAGGGFPDRNGGTAQSGSSTTVWPKPGENRTSQFGGRENKFGGENKFGSGENQFGGRERTTNLHPERTVSNSQGTNVLGTNALGAPGAQRGQAEFGRKGTGSFGGTSWPTKTHKPGPDDGKATSYEERPTALGTGERPGYYTVQPGDNYWTISRKTYGSARYFAALARFNSRRIPDPRKMRPGMHVLTPSVKVLKSSNPDLFPRHVTVAGGVRGHVVPSGFFRDDQGRPRYRVGDGDTLSDIAQKHLGRASRWIQVYEMNKDRLRDSKNLKIGTELRLPGDASRIRLVRGAREFR